MKTKIRFLPQARQQVAAAHKYLRQHSPAAAARFLGDLKSACGQLARFPASGHYIPEFPDLPHRQLIAGNYRVFYLHSAGAIYIAAVWHGAQLPELPARHASAG